MKITDKYVFFWGGILSNWHELENPIKRFGHKFTTSEHLFMYLKAFTFGDQEIMEQIIKSETPKEAKKLGRKVKNFDEAHWENFREYRMRDAVISKLEASKEFKEFLCSPEFLGKTFVEASPYDTVWGIGMSEEESGIDDSNNWKGLNLLGKVLTELRDECINAENNYPLNTWTDELIWCPSQCYYYLKDKNGDYWCIYLRWRHRDPWTAELVPCDPRMGFSVQKEWLQIPLSKMYSDSDPVKDLEKDALENGLKLLNEIVK